jgi:hypothetical protein
LVEWNSRCIGHKNRQKKEKKFRVVRPEKSSLVLLWEVVAMVKVNHYGRFERANGDVSHDCSD